MQEAAKHEVLENIFNICKENGIVVYDTAIESIITDEIRDSGNHCWSSSKEIVLFIPETEE